MLKLQRSFWLALISVGLLQGLGCAGPNIHKNLKQDRSVMQREWTRRSFRQWRAGERGTEYSNPVSYRNTIIYGNNTEGLIALYPIANKVRWALDIPGGVPNALSVYGNRVYFVGGDGFLYSVDLETGEADWRYNIRVPRASKAVVKGGRVFVTSADNTVYCLDAGSGEWIWHFKRRTSSIATIHGVSAPAVIGNTVYAGLNDGFLVKLSLNSGKLKSEVRLSTGSKFTDVDADLTISDGVIYIPSYDGSLYALKQKNDQVLWRFKHGGSKKVKLEKDRVYFPANDGTIYSLKKSNGKVLWKFELDGGSPTQLTIGKDYLFVASTHQYLYVLDKNSGKGLYRFDVGNKSGFSSAPLYVAKNDLMKQDRLYILSGAGHLYAFSVRHGKGKNKFQPKRGIFPWDK